jgi:type II secretory pathway component PulJ
MMIRPLVRKLRLARREEDGMTLVELMVSVALMMVVATIFTTMLVTIQRSVMQQQARSETNDQVRLAMQQLDREVRSGNFLSVPSTTSVCGGKTCAPGYSVKVWTQANVPTRQSASNPAGDQCVQWVIDGQSLYRRAWVPPIPPTAPPAASEGWRVAATGVVNSAILPQVPAFSLTGTKVLNVKLMMNSELGGEDAHRTVPVTTSIAIRNTASIDSCATEPAT